MLDFESSTASSLGEDSVYLFFKTVLETLNLNELPQIEDELSIEETVIENEDFLGL
jgi:hypothetical protein